MLKARLHGIVGDDFNSGTIAELLTEAEGQEIQLALQSEGGSVTEGLAIYRMLKDYPGKTSVRVESMSASIATVVMLGADHVAMSEAGFAMVHNPWAVALGDADGLRQSANVLDMLADQVADLYAANTGPDASTWLEIMAAETYFTASQALAVGLIDEVIPNASATTATKTAARTITPVATASASVATATWADAQNAANRIRKRIVDGGNARR